MIPKAVRNGTKRALRVVFEVGQRFGVDVLPRHFYSSVPDMRELRGSEAWMLPLSMAGVAGVDLDMQAAFLRSLVGPRTAAGPLHEDACRAAGEVGYGPVETAALRAFVTAKRPPSIVQAGCGVSTAAIRAAARAADYRPRLVCVEPYPSKFLAGLAAEGEITLLARKVQEEDLGVLTGLGPGDLLFIDSTHTVKPGSDVVRIILEVLPRLDPGVFVHFHDIYFPYTYQRGIMVDELFFSAESILLQAFLAMNPGYTIRFSLSMLHYDRREVLRDLFEDYHPGPERQGLALGKGHFPSAIYLERLDGEQKLRHSGGH